MPTDEPPFISEKSQGNPEVGDIQPGDARLQPARAVGPPSDCRYDRAVLVDVLVYHWPTRTSGCTCGWAVLGASFPEHVADVYEASVMARGS